MKDFEEHIKRGIFFGLFFCIIYKIFDIIADVNLISFALFVSLIVTMMRGLARWFKIEDDFGDILEHIANLFRNKK